MAAASNLVIIWPGALWAHMPTVLTANGGFAGGAGHIAIYASAFTPTD